MKIPFDIKFRPQIESGEYKVVTRDWSPVRIICWDANMGQPIVGLVYDSDEECETIEMFFDNGRYWQSGKESPFDLFIITQEPELTEFENGIKRGFLCAGLEDVPTGIIKDTAKELLEIAKKELCRDCKEYSSGYQKGLKDSHGSYEYHGPAIPAWYPPCIYGGYCTNQFHDCINCPRHSTVSINTTTGTSTAKLEG